jgi:broad specificity phosphatase PhoE
LKVYFVRHADKAAGNYYNDHLKHQDSPITEQGKIRAENLAHYFELKEISVVYASEYLRAQQTAAALTAKKRLEIIVDSRLNEIDNGIIEEMNNTEIKQKYPSFWNDFISYSKDVRFPGGETGEEVKARQRSLLNELIANGKNAALVSHEGYIRLLICNLLGLPVYERYKFAIDYCSITEIEFCMDSEEWKLIRMNQAVEPAANYYV